MHLLHLCLEVVAFMSPCSPAKGQQEGQGGPRNPSSGWSWKPHSSEVCILAARGDGDLERDSHVSQTVVLTFL